MPQQQYKDPAQERMEDGRTMADFMRRGPAGLRGVIVGKATPGGTPVNFDPHDMSKIKINIIDASGANVNGVTMDQMTPDRMTAAMNIANNAIQGNDIESIRERAAMVFEELAKMSKSSVQRMPVQRTNAVRAENQPVTLPPDEEEVIEELRQEIQHTQPPVEQVDRNYSPMAAFGMTPKSNRPIAVGASTASGGKSGPPQKLVYFEKEGIGTVPAFFHDVLVSVSPVDDDGLEESGFMVLVYDLRFDQNAARWFPPSNDPYQRPWAVKINNDYRLYLVQTTGFQYVYDNREYCILSVERAVIVNGD